MSVSLAQWESNATICTKMLQFTAQLDTIFQHWIGNASLALTATCALKVLKILLNARKIHIKIIKDNLFAFCVPMAISRMLVLNIASPYLLDTKRTTIH